MDEKERESSDEEGSPGAGTASAFTDERGGSKLQPGSTAKSRVRIVIDDAAGSVIQRYYMRDSDLED